MEALDNQNILCKVRFAAVNLDRLPKYGPEELNMCSLNSKMDGLYSQMNSLSSVVLGNPSAGFQSVKQLDDEVTSLSNRIKDQSTQFAATMEQAIAKLRSLSMVSATDAASATAVDHDRSRNIVIIGVGENRDSGTWRDVVSRALEAAAGREVQVEDAFHLGRYIEGKKRPVLVKLSSIWDRRLVLSGAHKLNQVAEFNRQVFIRADEPVELRRQKTLDRLKRKAEHDGKVTSVTGDGVLYVDGTAVFSLRSGSVRQGSSTPPQNG